MFISILVLFVIIAVGVATIGYLTYRLTLGLLTKMNRLAKRMVSGRQRKA